MSKQPKIPQADIVEACAHPKLLNIPLSLGQRTFLKALDGLEMDPQELDLFCAASGRDTYAPGHFHREGCLIAGRRFGKTHHIAVPTVIYSAIFRKFENTRPGERIMDLILAPTIPQAAVDFSGIRGVIQSSSLCRSLIESVKQNRISLSTGHDIAVWKSDLRQVRNLAIGTCVAEECAFWLDENDATVNPAKEILGSIRPALLQFEHGRLLLVSSPWSKSGPLWTAWQHRLERLEPLVMRMSTLMGNPVLTAKRMEEEQARDPERFEREINAAFLDAASALLPTDAVDSCTAKGRWETVPKTGMSYVAGIDAGFRTDSFAFAIAHAEASRVVVDLARSWKPRLGKPVQFAPVMKEIVETMKRFGARKAFADQVANEVIKQFLAQAGIELEQMTTLGRRASGIYSTLRTKVMSGEVEFPDNAELLSQLKRLEIIVSGGGQERCEASTGKDDLAIACALAVHQAVSRVARPFFEPFVLEIPIGRPSSSGEDRHDRWFRKIN